MAACAHPPSSAAIRRPRRLRCLRGSQPIGLRLGSCCADPEGFRKPPGRRKWIQGTWHRN
ncbi:hypothetical protein DV515_00014940 [Chloebia gouldiae]|uniref:Uncharacterized protein n=1 Tax=Chloebia gouldiae TaxID=44316 RepID=A0A3L8RWQ6_CHLGU|nr:hypothetical protein DV515_00014940 [Chloebia gouldiae]